MFGQWKADGVSATFVERKKWQYVTHKVPDKSAKSIHIPIYIPMKQLIDDYLGAFKLINCDRGTELLNRIYTEIIEKIDVKIYLAHPSTFRKEQHSLKSPKQTWIWLLEPLINAHVKFIVGKRLNIHLKKN